MALRNEPAPPPDWLLKLLKEPTKKAAADDKAEKIFEGERNDYLYRRGCGMRAKGTGVDEIYDSLLVINDKRCEPPLNEDEVRTCECRPA